MSTENSNLRRVWSVLQNPVIHTGLFVGVLLIGVMVGSLVVANRMPQFDPLASLRNFACYIAFGVVMTVPVARYLGSAWRIFTSGMTAWSVFTSAYACATMFFENLINRLNVTPFHLLMLGALIYGVIAAMIWVGSSLASVLGLVNAGSQAPSVPVAPRKQ